MAKSKSAALLNAEAEVRRARVLENVWAFRRDTMTRLAENARDLNKSCGYPETIAPADYLDMYKRMGVAARIVDIYPEESWRLDPLIYDDEDPTAESPFTEKLKEIIDQFNLFHYCERIDKMSGICSYGVLLIGVADGKELDQPVQGLDENGVSKKPTPKELLFLRPLDETMAPIAKWNFDKKTKRFGQPTKYNLKLVSVQAGEVLLGEVATAGDLPSEDTAVHWTRVVHVADNRTSSETNGSPRLENVFNNLTDIRKLLGGSAEMLWRGGFPGISFEVDPSLVGQVEIDKVALRKEMEAYSEGMQRYIANIGVTAKSLAPQVASPRDHIDVQYEALSIAKAVPKRILMGSEQGELASSEGTDAWNGRLKKRNAKYTGPMLLRVIIQRFIDIGILPPPKDNRFKIDWPDLSSPTEDDIATTAGKMTAALVAYSNSSAAQQVVPPANFMELILKWEQAVIEQVIEDAAQFIEDNPPPDDFGNPVDPETGEPMLDPLMEDKAASLGGAALAKPGDDSKQPGSKDPKKKGAIPGKKPPFGKK